MLLMLLINLFIGDSRPRSLQPCSHLRIYRFPMPDAENPDLGFYDFENNPVITDTELPVAFQGFTQRLSILVRSDWKPGFNSFANAGFRLLVDER